MGSMYVYSRCGYIPEHVRDGLEREGLHVGDMRFSGASCVPDAERITGEDREDGRGKLETMLTQHVETQPCFDTPDGTY